MCWVFESLHIKWQGNHRQQLTLPVTATKDTPIKDAKKRGVSVTCPAAVMYYRDEDNLREEGFIPTSAWGYSFRGRNTQAEGTWRNITLHLQSEARVKKASKGLLSLLSPFCTARGSLLREPSHPQLMWLFPYQVMPLRESPMGIPRSPSPRRF